MPAFCVCRNLVHTFSAVRNRVSISSRRVVFPLKPEISVQSDPTGFYHLKQANRYLSSRSICVITVNILVLRLMCVNGT